MERVEIILEVSTGSMGFTANAADLLANNQVQLAGAVDNLNARLAAEESALEAAAAAQMRYGRAANDNAHQRRQLVFQVNDTVQSLALVCRSCKCCFSRGRRSPKFMVLMKEVLAARLATR
ncbi:hypothetical protein F2981_02495 [Sinorhizobium meliloti]|nr:hypothetical protein [Sinorhizobium meliloti]